MRQELIGKLQSDLQVYRSEFNVNAMRTQTTYSLVIPFLNLIYCTCNIVRLFELVGREDVRDLFFELNRTSDDIRSG